MKRQTRMYCRDCASAFEVIYDLDSVLGRGEPELDIQCCPVCDGSLVDYIGHVDLDG